MSSDQANVIVIGAGPGGMVAGLHRCGVATVGRDCEHQGESDMPFVIYERNVVNHRRRHENISRRAFFKWLAAGQPHGRDLEFWLAAEDEELSHTGSKGRAPASIRARPSLAMVGGALPSLTERFSRAPRSFWPIT